MNNHFGTDAFNDLRFIVRNLVLVALPEKADHFK